MAKKEPFVYLTCACKDFKHTVRVSSYDDELLFEFYLEKTKYNGPYNECMIAVKDLLRGFKKLGVKLG